MRLIDADALSDALYHEAFETDSDMQKWDSGCWIRYKMFENAIEKAQTIEERKTGKWKVYKVVLDDVKKYYCPFCEEKVGVFATNYCPHCGAKMEGSEVFG